MKDTKDHYHHEGLFGVPRVAQVTLDRTSHDFFYRYYYYCYCCLETAPPAKETVRIIEQFIAMYSCLAVRKLSAEGPSFSF